MMYSYIYPYTYVLLGSVKDEFLEKYASKEDPDDFVKDNFLEV
jgi:hypothetical protein